MDMNSVKGFSIQEKLYASSNTETVRALRLQDKKMFILKLPLSEHPTQNEIASLYHEYHLLKTLNLNGLIHTHALIETTHFLILVLEDVAGVSLQHFLRQHTFDLKRFFTSALKLVDTIDTLHQKQIIHKDIKPANIIFDPITLNITLMDLSISSQLTEENLNYISLNKLEGTLAYMSPEQTGRMNLPLDYRSDFYSLGITFFEMLTGQLPFQAEDPLEIVHSHIDKTPPLVTELDPQLPEMVAAIIAKLLAKLPEERYASAVGLKKDLAHCAAEWQQSGKIAIFPLSRHDVRDKLKISHKLFGRDFQVQQVLDAFGRVSQQGTCEVLLVSGYSGVGKTAVVREVYKPIVRQKGYFITGKYDQLQRGTPYTAIIAAFLNLVRQVLADSEINRTRIKQELLAAVGNIGRVIIDLIPEVELLMGKQPPVPTFGFVETQNRFNLVFQKFIRVFATAQHPLVIFLDDLQWADSASLSFIETLFSDPNTQYLFLIGSYRDNEVTIDHPLLATIQHLQKCGISTESITLYPLQISDIEQLLLETFGCDRARVTPLAILLHEKTLGNPLFICEFLKALYQEKKIQYAYVQGEWQWDMVALQRTKMTHSIIELLSVQIHKLPEDTQQILKLSACIGHSFSLQTLAVISEKTLLEVAQHLWQAMQARFIVALEDSNKTAMLAEANHLLTDLAESEILYYQFSHDRVQHAAYNLIPEATRQQMHLQIGRLLLKKHSLQENDAQLFNTVNQFNQSISLITDPAEKKALAHYNLWAGNKAKVSTAYSAALGYFQAGSAFLTEEAWKQDYALIFPLYLELAVSSYLTGQLQNAEQFFMTLLQHAQDKLDKIKVYEAKMALCNMLARYNEVAEIGITGLRLLGVRLSSHPNKLQVLASIVEIIWQTTFRKVEEIELIPMQDQRRIYISRILAAMAAAAYFSNPNLVVVVLVKLIILSMKYGYMEESTFAYMTGAFIFICKLKQWKTGFAFSNLSHRLMDKSPHMLSDIKSRTVFLAIIQHWKYPMTKCLEPMLKEYHLALEAGSLGYAAYNLVSNTIASFTLGRPLEEMLQKARACVAFEVKNKIIEAQVNVQTLCSTIQGLQGTLSLSDKKLLLDENMIHTWNNKAESCQIYHQFLVLHYILGNFEQALRIAKISEPYTEVVDGQTLTAEYVLLYALSIMACYPQAENSLKKKYLLTLKKLIKQIKQWAQWCPINFEHYYFLVSAERLTLQPNYAESALEILDLYDKAIASARENEYLHFEGIENERAADFCTRIDKPHIAKCYMVRAHQAYQRWGALAKCKLLEERYPYLLQLPVAEPIKNSTQINKNRTTTVHADNQDFDMLSTLKFTLAVSNEIQLDKLLKKLISIILQNTSASRCVLLCKQGEAWVIEAEGSAEKSMIFLQPHAITDSSALPLTLLDYIQRVFEPVIIDDAVHTEQTVADSYVVKTKLKSVLALPIRYQGQLRRIFYLENNLMTGAFTYEHLQMLQLLGTQAAISLENAYFYYQATHDPLTGLANRNLLYQTFADYINSPDMRKDEKIVILFLDLDRFKRINDTLGHEVGDKLLLYMTEQLNACVQEGGLAVRLGGDEFVLMIKNVKNKAQVKIITDKLSKLLTLPATIEGHKLSVSTSIGMSAYPEDGKDIHTLLRVADIALYREKEIHHQQVG